ncbi:hypothetical protein NDU88_002290 [Pleurodeles waltl]|uniref:Uncharacterized protein n=1 Tax=Pleurodeles waltl TaxID=8319 RepID=A0AAV7M204_PLEWA|nr:hypothetical protein NDU88_002290 [Pleurodeles waltl]
MGAGSLESAAAVFTWPVRCHLGDGGALPSVMAGPPAGLVSPGAVLRGGWHWIFSRGADRLLGLQPFALILDPTTRCLCSIALALLEDNMRCHSSILQDLAVLGYLSKLRSPELE